jgi:hypothetical protein
MLVLNPSTLTKGPRASSANAIVNVTHQREARQPARHDVSSVASRTIGIEATFFQIAVRQSCDPGLHAVRYQRVVRVGGEKREHIHPRRAAAPVDVWGSNWPSAILTLTA